jgi:branched-chain amino acid aminotransferase
MNECSGKNFILNGDLQLVDVFNKSLVYEGDSVYEVLRLHKGCPIFFNDHMDRLTASVRLQKKDFPTTVSALRNAIITLSRIGKRRDSNLKIVFNYNNSEINYLVYFIESMYPTALQYQNGVKGILFSAERKDPESKVINHKLRTSIYHKLMQESAYEALLVNENNQITEGSRSNIFFLKNDKLFTAPDDLILNGITRKQILDLCTDNKIEVELECVKVEQISDYDAVFMTGTSPMVLPFSGIDDIRFNVNFPLIEKLRTLYQKKADASVGQFRELYQTEK